jgi:GntR family transcriptional repressor for pyruvate dehydrogenase complex
MKLTRVPESDRTFVGRLSRTSLLEILTERIESEIRSGAFTQGARLPPEAELASHYGVSRPLVREALAELRARGYVETRSGNGSFVRSPDALYLAEVLLRQAADESTREITADDLYGARSAIEVAAAAAAAEAADAEDLEELGALLQRMIDNVEDPVAFTAADIGFHLAVARASGNALLPTMLSPLVKVIVSGALESAAKLEAVQAGIRGHSLILERLRMRDPEGAAEAVRQHLLESRGFFPESVPISRLISSRP